MVTTLPVDVIALLLRGQGLVTTASLQPVGIRRNARATLLRRGLLVAVARGVYSAPALLQSLDEWTLFALRSRAFAMAAPEDAVAAGWSGVALQDLPHLGRPPTAPCVIRRSSPPRGSDASPRGRTRFASLDPGWITMVAGVPVVHPAVTVIDVGRRSGRLATLVVADAVARLPGGPDSMRMALEAMRRWPGSGRSAWAVAHADGDCESPLESVGRYAILRAHLPVPMSNVWLGVDGPRYRVDHYWPEQRVALEGDGVQKYRMTGSRGEDDALVVEKEREFELRSWGVAMDRYTWRRALFDPGSVAGRCAAALGGPPLPAHPGLRWWPAAEGYRLRGMSVPTTQLGIGAGWQQCVDSALRRIYGPPHS
jgi:hypothetical protein